MHSLIRRKKIQYEAQYKNTPFHHSRGHEAELITKSPTVLDPVPDNKKSQLSYTQNEYNVVMPEAFEGAIPVCRRMCGISSVVTGRDQEVGDDR